MTSLSQFDTKTKSNAGVEIELLSPSNGTPTGVFFTVLGTDSDAFRKANAERARRTLELIKANDNKPLDDEQNDELTADLLAACTTSFRGLVDSDSDAEDKSVPFSKAKAAQIYIGYPTIREQIETAIGNRRAFLKA